MSLAPLLPTQLEVRVAALTKEVEERTLSFWGKFAYICAIGIGWVYLCYNGSRLDAALEELKEKTSKLNPNDQDQARIYAAANRALGLNGVRPTESPLVAQARLDLIHGLREIFGAQMDSPEFVSHILPLYFQLTKATPEGNILAEQHDLLLSLLPLEQMPDAWNRHKIDLEKVDKLNTLLLTLKFKIPRGPNGERHCFYNGTQMPVEDALKAMLVDTYKCPRETIAAADKVPGLLERLTQLWITLPDTPNKAEAFKKALTLTKGKDLADFSKVYDFVHTKLDENPERFGKAFDLWQNTNLKIPADKFVDDYAEISRALITWDMLSTETLTIRTVEAGQQIMKAIEPLLKYGADLNTILSVGNKVISNLANPPPPAPAAPPRPKLDLGVTADRRLCLRPAAALLPVPKPAPAKPEDDEGKENADSDAEDVPHEHTLTEPLLAHPQIGSGVVIKDANDDSDEDDDFNARMADRMADDLRKPQTAQAQHLQRTVDPLASSAPPRAFKDVPGMTEFSNIVLGLVGLDTDRRDSLFSKFLPIQNISSIETNRRASGIYDFTVTFKDSQKTTIGKVAAGGRGEAEGREMTITKTVKGTIYLHEVRIEFADDQLVVNGAVDVRLTGIKFDPDNPKNLNLIGKAGRWVAEKNLDIPWKADTLDATVAGVKWPSL